MPDTSHLRAQDADRANHARAGAPIRQRHPYVGEGADGCRRSAQIDREEADTLDRDHPRYEALLVSAADWERQAEATG